MVGVVTEEKSIIHAQYLDLVYYQLGTLYDLIPHAPHPTTDPSIPSMDPLANGALGSIQTKSTAKSLKKEKNLLYSSKTFQPQKCFPLVLFQPK